MSYRRAFAGGALMALISLVPASAKPVVREIANLGGGAGSVIWQERQVLATQRGLGQIVIWNNRQSQVLATLSDCGPSSMLTLRGGGYLVSCAQNPRLIVLNSYGQQVESFPRPAEETGLVRIGATLEDIKSYDISGITAMVQDSRGGVYIAATGSSQANSNAAGKGRIFYLNASRSGITPMASNLNYPAGLALSRDGKQLFVSEGTSRQIRRFDLNQGQLTNATVFARMADLYTPSASAVEDPRPGALAFNNQGHLYIALEGEGRILVASPQGKTIASLEVPQPYVKGFSFSRTDRQLYISASPNPEATARGYLYELQL
ncbi:MAG: SMP-30/gluconolactonase/LRE family protein [Candidatus Sericytochromatia bacterium]